jgi:ring-1,2-phenylacetyl-CoA epoxidase subunit PaaC
VNPVVLLLFCLADDELIIGHRNSEWTGIAPILEEDIAFSSMAQDEIGHALTYYRLLHELGEADPDTLAFRRPAARYRCAHLVEWPREDWAFSLARQFLYDGAESVRLAALAESSYTPLAQAARKLAGEEKYHWMHGRAWMLRLGQATPDSRARMQAALDKAFPLALGLFEATEAEAGLLAERVKPAEADLCRKWLELIMPVLEAARLAVPVVRQNGGWRVMAAAAEGGRAGQHTTHLDVLLDDMQAVYRTDPEAEW